MVNQCANTKCEKPLHYLREGRIYIFDMLDGAGRRLQHFWLCGRCSETLAIEQTTDKEIRVVGKKGETAILTDSMAS